MQPVFPSAYATSSSSSSSTPLQTAQGVVQGHPPLEDETDLPEALGPEPASRVIHFRNVTQEIEQGDLMSLLVPYGNVDHVLQMRTKNQVLVMYHSLRSAIEFMNHYLSNNTQPSIKGRKMYVKYSNHQVINATNSLVSNVILVTMETNEDPAMLGIQITTEIVYQMFSPYGTVEKIVIMSKGDARPEGSREKKYQALVQLHTQQQCVQAYDYLHDKSVYVGTEPHHLEIKMFIQWSHLAELTVKYTSATSQDYTLGQKLATALVGSSANASQDLAQLQALQSAQGPLLPTPGGVAGADPALAAAQAAFKQQAALIEARQQAQKIGVPPASGPAVPSGAPGAPPAGSPPPPGPGAAPGQPPAPYGYPPAGGYYPPGPPSGPPGPYGAPPGPPYPPQQGGYGGGYGYGGYPPPGPYGYPPHGPPHGPPPSPGHHGPPPRRGGR